MRSLLSLPSSMVFSSLLLATAILPLQAAAQTVETSEYIYIGFEAEDHVSKDDRWVTTTPSTPTEENDPDGNHSDQAGGSTYLELLPDVRVTHEDEFGPPLAYWGRGGQGPGVEYLIDFPEPGRYYVHARAYSTGTEDNGMHVGLNGQWPDSGQRMQFCIAHHRAWWWGSAQRDAGGNGSCGTEKTIWLDVPTAGVHTVNVSAREDGFELDRLALIKDLSGNTRVCSPTTLTGVGCRNGSIESADDFVDLRVILNAEELDADPDVEPPNPTEVVQGNSIKLTAIVENLDAFDTANDIVVTLSPVPGDWNMVYVDPDCTAVGDEYKCTLDSLHPTAPNENETFLFTMQARVDGDIRIDASLLSADVDDSPANDVAATIVRVLPGVAPADQDTDISVTMIKDKADYETGDAVELSVMINNAGNFAAKNVLFSLDPPAGLTLNAQSLPNECSFAGQVECSFTTIATSASELFKLNFIGDDAGSYTLPASVSSSNDNNASNNQASSVVVVVEPSEETNTTGTLDGEVDGTVDGTVTTTTTGGTTTGGTATDGAASAGATTSDNAGETSDGTSTVDSDTSGTATTGGTAGDTSAGVDSGETPAVVVNESKSGAMAHWFILLMVLMCLTRLYGLHQRKLVAINK